MVKLEALCQLHATDEEIAAHFSCSTKTIQRLKRKPAYAAVFEKGRADGKISLRRAQYQEALKGSPSMLIWLGKQLLGQRERYDRPGPTSGPVPIDTVRAMLDGLSEEDFNRLASEAGVEVSMSISHAPLAGDVVIDVSGYSDPRDSSAQTPTAAELQPASRQTFADAEPDDESYSEP